MKVYTHLSPEQRYQIEILHKAEHSQTEVAELLGVSKSTVSRELKRNAQQQAKGEVYKARFAQTLSDKRKQLKPTRFKTNSAIKRRIVWLLRRLWSPEQIAATCAKRGLEMLSTEAIYLWLYEQKKAGADHTRFLRRRHRKRRKRRLDKQPRGSALNKVSIEDRPEAIKNRERAGDFEVDLTKCKNGYIVVASDRKNTFNLLKKVPDKTAQTVRKAIEEIFEPFKEQLMSITSDNGTEFAQHQAISQTFGVTWYFAHPHSPQERGTNENQIGLLRQLFPRKTDLSQVSDQQILNAQKQLNSRPRKKLRYETPKSQFEYSLHSLTVALAT